MNDLWSKLWQTCRGGKGEEKLEIHEKYVFPSAENTVHYVKYDTTI